MPGEGFEPPTFGLQNRCTATVLTRPTCRRDYFKMALLLASPTGPPILWDVNPLAEQWDTILAAGFQAFSE